MTRVSVSITAGAITCHLSTEAEPAPSGAWWNVVLKMCELLAAQNEGRDCADTRHTDKS